MATEAVVGALEVPVATGARMRLTGGPGPLAVVCLNGGRAGSVPGDWSPSLEWLVRRLAPAFPHVQFAEVRYRVKSWRQLEMCIDDGAAAIDAVVARGARQVALMGFSMGGAVSLACAGAAAVRTVIGLAPWIPEKLDVSGMRGRSLRVIHGSLDQALPGIPGVSATSSRRGADRVAALGVPVDYTLIPGGLHGIALRPFGRLVTLPRAGEWERLVSAAVERFAGQGGYS